MDVIDLCKIRESKVQDRKVATVCNLSDAIIYECSGSILPSQQIMGVLANILGRMIYKEDPELSSDLLEKVKLFIETSALKEKQLIEKY